MTTRAELLRRARRELNDLGATRLWSDALLRDWLAEAIHLYSARLPREATTTWASVAGQASYPLPADFLRALRLEHPEQVFRVYAPSSGGEVLEDDASGAGVEGARPLAFEVYGGALALDPAPERDGETIRLRYLARYPEPAADDEALATPPADDALLVWLVCARALDWLATDEAKRMRVERRLGAPTAQQADRYRERFEAALHQRVQAVRGERRLVARW